MTLFGSIAAVALAAILAYILTQIYFEVTKRLGIPNAYEVVCEILGGWILAFVLWYERGIDYGE